MRLFPAVTVCANQHRRGVCRPCAHSLAVAARAHPLRSAARWQVEEFAVHYALPAGLISAVHVEEITKHTATIMQQHPVVKLAQGLPGMVPGLLCRHMLNGDRPRKTLLEAAMAVAPLKLAQPAAAAVESVAP